MARSFLRYAVIAGLAALVPVATAAADNRAAIEQVRGKITAARAEPGVAANGREALDRAERALRDLDATLGENPLQARSINAEIDTLIEVARVRARIAIAKVAPPPVQPVRGPDPVRGPRNPKPPPGPAPQTLVLQDVAFDTGVATLKPGADARLRPLIGYMRDNPDVRVRIAGHADAREGDPATNRKLSERRAAAVRDRLVAAGIGAKRITARGFGDTLPVGNNGTAEGRQANRRVELTLIGGGRR